MLDDRGQVDLVDVGGPVDGGGVDAERGLVVFVHPVPQGDQPVDPVEGVGLGVGAVELDVAQRPVGQEVLLLEGGHPLGLLAADRQGAHHPLGERHGLGRTGQLALDPAATGEGPLGHHDGLAVLVVDGVFGEPRRHQFDELAVAERVPHSRSHVVHRRPGIGIRRVIGSGVQQCLAGHGDDGGHHEVDRDDVGDALGHPRKLL